MKKENYIIKGIGGLSKELAIVEKLRKGEKVKDFCVCSICGGSGFGKSSFNMCKACWGKGYIKKK